MFDHDYTEQRDPLLDAYAEAWRDFYDDPARASGQAVFVVLILALALVVLWQWPNRAQHAATIRQALNGPVAPAQSQQQSALPRPASADDLTLQVAQSLTAEQADAILAEYGSPAAGTGAAWVELGNQYGIDAAIALAFFVHESGAGTASNWAGHKSGGATTHNPGNIICAGYATCHGRFRDYPDWQTGIADWYRLLDDEYIEGRKHTTVQDVIPVYAPAFENDIGGYVAAVEELVSSWRTKYQTPLAEQGSVGDAAPRGNPLGANSKLTQAYGVGTHAPAATWGAVDLAIQGPPSVSMGAPIYATHEGIATITSGSWPAGNHVWITGANWRTGYAHLSDFAVQHGQRVERGEVIGFVGSTGQSSGPHLDYQVWQKQGGQWVNVDPTPLLQELP
jgi:murein DD-endopeptidase MepM/ murein hydrolase activator NlpD